MSDPRTAQKQQRDGHQAHHDDGAEIRLEQHEPAENADDDQRGQKPASKQRDLVRFLGQVGGEVDDGDELDHLGRLDRDETPS